MTDLRIINADVMDGLVEIENESVSAIVTDPPYELGFMGKAWDASGITYNVDVWRGCLRVLKPGGHLLAFGGSRTYHRLACAVEDAEFEVRDQIMWLYGSGFPKSLDVSKAIDKAAGVEREVVLVPTKRGNLPEQAGVIALGASGMTDISTPVTTNARKWQGWGTALKPAHEPIVVARKPFKGTVAANVLKHGTGAVNVDGSRVGMEELPAQTAGQARIGTFKRDVMVTPMRAGRFPANVIHDGSDEVVSRFPVDGNDTAARFFYTAKASRSEREYGCDSQPAIFAPTMGDGIGGKEHNPETATPKRNNHPTVKPLDLMRYLIRLVTPPGGVVLDPFAGSGSTLVAARDLGFPAIGIEINPEYVELIEKRCALPWERTTETDAEQPSLFDNPNTQEEP
jgi:site-specific DNA-methyltransferase (adenine-specific)